MTSKIAAAESIRRLAVQYQDMVAAADALEKMGSIEQAIQEAQRALDAAQIERDRMRAELQTMREQSEQINANLAESVVAAEQRVKGIIESAQGRAGEIVAEAEHRAAGILSAGQAQASQELAKMSEQLAAMQSKLTELTEEANAAIVRRDQADAAAAEAENNLAGVQARIRKLAEGA